MALLQGPNFLESAVPERFSAGKEVNISRIWIAIIHCQTTIVMPLSQKDANAPNPGNCLSMDKVVLALGRTIFQQRQQRFCPNGDFSCKGDICNTDHWRFTIPIFALNTEACASRGTVKDSACVGPLYVVRRGAGNTPLLEAACVSDSTESAGGATTEGGVL